MCCRLKILVTRIYFWDNFYLGVQILRFLDFQLEMKWKDSFDSFELLRKAYGEKQSFNSSLSVALSMKRGTWDYIFHENIKPLPLLFKYILFHGCSMIVKSVHKILRSLTSTHPFFAENIQHSSRPILKVNI